MYNNLALVGKKLQDANTLTTSYVVLSVLTSKAETAPRSVQSPTQASKKETAKPQPKAVELKIIKDVVKGYDLPKRGSNLSL